MTRAITFGRAALPIPTITIKAPPLLLFRASSGVLLAARAKLLSCFAANNTALTFNWTHAASTPMSASPLALDQASRYERDLLPLDPDPGPHPHPHLTPTLTLTLTLS